MSSLAPNPLYCGDCLDWMGEWGDESVDLICLDPPLSSKADYNVLYGTEGSSEAQYRAFEDTWHWDDNAENRLAMFESATGRPAHNVIVGLYRILGRSGMLAYLSYMAERLEHMHRLLKPSGSLYLHCDPIASHYLKVVLYAIFGAQGFRTEITWQRTSSHNDGAQGRKQYGRICDVNPYSIRGERSGRGIGRQYMRYDQQYLDRLYRRIEEGTGRRYQLGDIKPVGAQAKEHLGHPTQKLLALYERIIKASSNEGDLVLDPSGDPASTWCQQVSFQGSACRDGIEGHVLHDSMWGASVPRLGHALC